MRVGAVVLIIGGVVSAAVLLTVTAIGEEFALLFDVSLAIAVNVCWPFVAVEVFHEIE